LTSHKEDYRYESIILSSFKSLKF